MRLTQMRFRWIILITLVVAGDLLAFGVWASRPSGPPSLRLGLTSEDEAAPIRRLQAWARGQVAPRTPYGCLSLFEAEELLYAGLILLPLPFLAALLTARRHGDRMGARPDTAVRVPRTVKLRFRVTTALAAVAVTGLYLGWEIEAWRTWRLRSTYQQRAASFASFEEQSRSGLRSMSEALDRLESDAWHPDDPSQPRFAHYTQAALTSQRAVSGAWMRRHVRYMSDLVDAYAARRRKYERAAANPRATVEPDPPLPEPEPDAASLLGRKDYARALAAYDELCRSYPGFVQGHLDRAWIRATCPDPRFREGKLAVESARMGCELTDWSDGHALNVLAAAFAEAGDYPEAARWQEEAIDRTTDDANAKAYRDRLNLYRTGRPFRMD